MTTYIFTVQDFNKMKLKIILIVALVCLSVEMKCYSTEDDNAWVKAQVVRSIFSSLRSSPTKDQFKAFHYLFKKSYDLNSDEGLSRYRIFKKNLKYIEESNAANQGFTLGLHESADLTLEEYAQQYLMKPQEEIKIEEKAVGEDFFDKFADSEEELVKGEEFIEVSWEKYKTPIRNQKYCGSCWAFASLTAIATNMYIKTGSQIELLSPQFLVDCDMENTGCDGGWARKVFMSIIDLKGVPLEKNYPYVSGQVYPNTKQRETCRPNVERIDILEDYDDGRFIQENKFFNLLKRGALYAAMDAESDKFRFYQGGPIELICTHSNHAITVLGSVKKYDSEVIIIQNSWGLDWGYKGLMELKTNKADNRCFLENSGFLPIVKLPKPDNKCLLIANDCNTLNAQKLESCTSLPTLPFKADKFFVNMGKFKGQKVYFFDKDNCAGGKLYYDGEETCFSLPLKSFTILPEIVIKPNCFYAFEIGCMTGQHIEICDIKSYNFQGFKVGSIILGDNYKRAKLVSMTNSSISISEKYNFSVYEFMYQQVKSIEIQ